MRKMPASLSSAEMQEAAAGPGEARVPRRHAGTRSGGARLDRCRLPAGWPWGRALRDLADAEALSVIAREHEGGLDGFITACGYPPGSRF